MKKLAFLLMCLPGLTTAKVTLPSIFSDGMVLQQNTQVKIWGTADSQESVNIAPSWSDQTYQVRPAADGKWNITIPTSKADFKPYSLKISHHGTSTAIQDILFGEVWLCSGQSNMEMKMRGWYGSPINGGREAIANSRNENIRLFNVDKVFSTTEKTDCNGQWKKAEPATISTFSATAYFFGKQLFNTLNVPVALVTSHWGGASIVSFISEPAIQSFSEYKEKLKERDNKPLDQFMPSTIYNSMINPIIGFGIKGAIWYQGETDRKIPDLYRKLFSTLLNDWRGRWGIGDFPFIYAQIAPFDYPNEIGNSAYIREAQLLGQKENAKAYMISLTDIGEEHNIHPSEKKEVGLRMALRALDKVYQIEGICSDEPLYQSMKIEGNKVTLLFDHAEKGLTTYGKELKGFTLAGNDKVFYPAKAVIRNNHIEVSSEKVLNPVAVRYAFTEFEKGNLYNIEGCCASSFRTDDWEETDCRFH